MTIQTRTTRAEHSQLNWCIAFIEKVSEIQAPSIHRQYMFEILEFAPPSEIKNFPHLTLLKCQWLLLLMRTKDMPLGFFDRVIHILSQEGKEDRQPFVVILQRLAVLRDTDPDMFYEYIMLLISLVYDTNEQYEAFTYKEVYKALHSIAPVCREPTPENAFLALLRERYQSFKTANIVLLKTGVLTA